jgi:signal transduction histidine kinase
VLLLDAESRIVALSDSGPSLLARSKAAALGERLSSLFRPAHEADIERCLRIRGRTTASMENGRRFDLAVQERADGLKAVLLVAAAEPLASPARKPVNEAAHVLADLSHEMRTPLNAVIGFAEAMTKETFGPLGHDKYREYAAHIRASGAHLLDLVSAILDMAKIEAGRLELQRELIEPSELARECAGIMRHAAEAAGLKLVVDVPPDLPSALLDPRAVRQILLNLLSNAVKFTSDGEVRLAATLEGGDIVFTVSDTGVGMSAEELKRLGPRFSALAADGVRGAKGAGLGLALAAALAELHEGTLTLQSAPGEGMTARVRLPVKAPAAPARRFHLRPVAAASSAQKPVPPVLTQLERVARYRRERASAA